METINIKPNQLKLGGSYDKLFEWGKYPKPFEFNDEVAKVFDNMVSRSVPLYHEVNHSLVEWAYYYCQGGGKVYDIGCSTGTTLLALAQQIKEKTKFVGIDTSSSMLDQAREKLAKIPKQHDLQLLCENALSVDYSEATMVIMNYTLQFIEVIHRRTLLEKVFAGLEKGGVLFLSEKVRSKVPQIQEMLTRSYENFKFHRGYSVNEIERKKEALDQVLVPLSMEEQMTLISEVGFSACEPIMRWNNFVTYVAIK
ncbi:MAG: carboxy-S-adenosyl-L-methionine synthase CmoA [Oligoflexales bacterium]|nr:carboxy-S-adenosyl-L-methionine synthase CmoA [Oligoflexales bacterium]